MGVADTGAGSFFVKRKSCRDQTNYICINEKRGSLSSAVREAEQRYHFSIFESVSFRPCQRCGCPGDYLSEAETDTFLHADMVVEGFEEVDMTFLQRVYERHFNIPWTILETERCIVRELELSDLDDLFSMYAEPGMTDYMEGLYEYEEELEYQKAYIENMYRFYGYGIWLVFEKKTGTLIGRAGVEHREELNGDMELGYAIRTSFQHQGYAYEVCQAIMQYAGEELQVHLLHCLIQKENALSEKLAIKLGFSYCGDREIDGVLMSDYQIEW